MTWQRRLDAELLHGLNAECRLLSASLETDVIVVGAGMAGLAAAGRLADAGAKVTLLERAPGGRTGAIRGDHDAPEPDAQHEPANSR